MNDLAALIGFFETHLPRWWREPPAAGIKPLQAWFLWTESREIDAEDPASLAYSPGRANEIFFRMILDQQYGSRKGVEDPFMPIYALVRNFDRLDDAARRLGDVETLKRLGKEGGGWWRFRQIPESLADNAGKIVAATGPISFEKYLHRLAARLLGKTRFVFPDIHLDAPEVGDFAGRMVGLLLSDSFRLKRVGENMASYGLRHFAQIPGAWQLFKADYHNLRLGSREEVSAIFARCSAELLRRCGDKEPQALWMFSPAALNMAVYLAGRLRISLPRR